MAEYDHRIEQEENSTLRIEHLVTLMDTEDEIFCVQYDPADKYVACGCGDGTIRVFNIHTGKMAFLLANPKGHEIDQMPITWLKWRPTTTEMKTKNILVASAADGSIYHWHVTSGRLLHTIEPENRNHVYCLDYSPDGRNLAAGWKDCSVTIIDEHTKSQLVKLTEGGGRPGHSNRVFSVKYSPDDPNFLVSGSWDNTVLLWDLRKKEPLDSVYGPHICGDSIDIRGDRILVGSYSNEDNLYVIDMRKMKTIKNIDWFGEDFERTEFTKPSSLYSALYTSDDKYVVAGGTNRNEVRIFKNDDPVDGYKVVGKITDLDMACLSVDVENKGLGFAFGCADGYLRIMNMEESKKIDE